MTSCVKMVLPQITNSGEIAMNQSHFNTIEVPRKSGKHLSLEVRDMIQALHWQGLSFRGIVAAVNCSYYRLLRTPAWNSGEKGLLWA